MRLSSFRHVPGSGCAELSGVVASDVTYSGAVLNARAAPSSWDSKEPRLVATAIASAVAIASPPALTLARLGFLRTASLASLPRIRELRTATGRAIRARA